MLVLNCMDTVKTSWSGYAEDKEVLKVAILAPIYRKCLTRAYCVCDAPSEEIAVGLKYHRRKNISTMVQVLRSATVDAVSRHLCFFVGAPSLPFDN